MNQEEFKILFKRYAAGSCSKEEQVLIQKILLKKPMSNGWQWSSEEQRLLMKIKIKQGIDPKLGPTVSSFSLRHILEYSRNFVRLRNQPHKI